MTVSIRLAVESDAEELQAIYVPYICETVISFELEPPDVQEMRERIRKTLVWFPWLVCEQDDTILGFTYASRHRERLAYQWSVDVTAYVLPNFHRSGIGRGLYTSLFSLLRLQGFVNAFAGIALPNDASIGLHQALGFELIGVYQNVGYKFGKWHHVAWLGRALQFPVTSPAPPHPLTDIMQSPDWQLAVTDGLSLIRL